MVAHACDLNREQWQLRSVEAGLPRYTGDQVYRWITQKGNLAPDTFTNIPKSAREWLQQDFCWAKPVVESCLDSSDGTSKCLLKMGDGIVVEMVLMRHKNRISLCVSSQSGCRMGCIFCQTGKMGFKRNLTAGEILLQLILANSIVREETPEASVRNVVFMGMGEPLDNFDAVVQACAVMIDPEGFGLARSRVTISTAGLVPEIRKLGEVLPMRLAVSLHSADEAVRSEMMPVNRRYPLAELKQALLDYPAREGITFEYLMIAGKNDTLQDAKKLVRFIHGLKAKVNLIPMNHFPGMALHPSSAEQMRQFQQYLSDRSIPAPVRYSRGQDISAGCGQLAAKRENELDLDPRVLRRRRG